MTDNPNTPSDPFTRKVAATELEGKTRRGEAAWGAAIEALRRANPQGVDRDVMTKRLSGHYGGLLTKGQTDSGADAVYAEGVDRLIELADSDPALDNVYRELRDAQRAAHRKGRR